MSRLSCHAQSGFTLVELMISSLVLVIGVLSVMSMILFALSSSYASRIESTALRLSEKKIEELRALPIDDPKLAGPGNPLDSALDIDFSFNPAPLYCLETEVVLNSSKNTKTTYETRWNITTQGKKRIITVATRNKTGTPFRLKPVNLKLARVP